MMCVCVTSPSYFFPFLHNTMYYIPVQTCYMRCSEAFFFPLLFTIVYSYICIYILAMAKDICVRRYMANAKVTNCYTRTSLSDMNFANVLRRLYAAQLKLYVYTVDICWPGRALLYAASYPLRAYVEFAEARYDLSGFRGR